MAWFRRKRPIEDAASEQRSTYPVYAPMFGYPNTASGEPVTLETAMRSAAVTACVRVLKTTIVNFPVDEVISTGNIRTPVKPSKIVEKPSGKVSQRQWLAQFVDSLITAGNMNGKGYDFDASGRPTQVDIYDPSRIRWWKVDGEDTPHIDGKPQRLWPLGDFIHVPATAFLRAGHRVADAPVELAKEAIGTSLAAERYGAQFFGNGAHPSAIVKSDQELDAIGAQHIKNKLMDSWANHAPAVMGSGLEVEAFQVDPKNTQFVDLLRFEVEQACRFFGVPPSMVFAAISGQNITYANVSESDLTYLKYSVTSWLLDIEDAWSSWLTQPRRVKLNTASLLRMDAKSRHELYKVRLESKTTTVNEVRALEDEQPFEGDEYDEPGIPGGEAPTPNPPNEEPPSE